MYGRIKALLFAALFAFAGIAAAQETTGSIAGRIVDPQQLGIPGVTVNVTGPQGTRSVVTDGEGRFSAPLLVPGSYTVRAELQGFRPAERRNVTVALGQTSTVNLAMEVGGLTETVTVTEVTPVVDTTSTTTGAVISSDMLQRVPVGRRVSDTLYLAPGVNSSASAGRGNPSMAGGSGLDNQYVIDGVNITNQGYGALGSYSIIFGSLGNATPFDFVQEVQVKTGGYEAEYGQSIGGVMNVITKSGSNTLTGSVFAYSQPSGTEGEWKQYQSDNGTVQTLSTQDGDFGAEGGGPVVRNHVFFFGAIDPKWETRTFQAPDGFPLFQDGGYDRKRRSTSYSAKGTFQLGSGNRIDASFFGDPSHGETGPQRTSSLLASDLTQFSELDYGGHNQTVRYSGVFGGTWLVEGAYSHALNKIAETPQINDWRVTDRTVVPNVRTGGIGTYEKGNNSINNQYSVKSTNLVGGHSVKYGYEFDDVEYSNINQRTGPTFTAPNGQQTATGAVVDIIADPTYGRIYRVVRANFNSGRVTTQQYHQFFVQDSWQVNDKLTINPGIRYEQEKLAGTIIDDFSLKNNWAPRLGVVYNPNGTGDTKIFGSYGRFYARIPNDLAARALSSDDGFSRGDYFDANLTQPIPDGVLAGGQTIHFQRQGIGADEIDPDAKLSYLDEYVLGAEREVLPNTTFGVRYIHRQIGRVLEDVANCPVAAYDFSEATKAACGSVEYILTNPSVDTPINADLLAVAPEFGVVSFDDPSHKYDAVEVTLNRRFTDNWSTLASYTWSRLRGNFEGFYREDNGQSDPGITALYDFPTNDPTYTQIGSALGYEGDIRYLGQDGILPLERPHALKVTGNYLFDSGLSLGMNLRVNSGRSLTALAPNPNYGNAGEIPLTPRGDGFETIDGFKKRTPVESQVDLQASYNLNLGGRNRLTLMADMFNLFNRRSVLEYNNFSSLTFGGGPNPDFGTPTSGNISGPQFATPFQLRIGARLSF